MKYRYVRFNNEITAAVRDGIKTEFRCLMKDENVLPYQPGDILWLKETWAEIDSGLVYRADDEAPRGWQLIAWKPSIHMRPEQARLFIRVESVRVCQLQDITEEEISMEGIWIPGCIVPRDEYGRMWNQSLRKRQRELYGWEQNPTVCAVRFVLCDRPEDWDGKSD